MNDGLEAAVRDRIIDRVTAERLRPYLMGDVPAPDAADPDDEKLRLVTGFNDIFVTIGVLIFIGALFFLIWPGVLTMFVVAAAAWGLAEFFTRRRRMALPSIVLLLIFVGAVFFAVLTMSGSLDSILRDGVAPFQIMLAGVGAAVAAFLHWTRFHVPVTVAAGTGALAAILLSAFGLAAPALLKDHPIAVFLPLGIAVFMLAMWFDSSDLKRQTRRTDIAFWLHLLAAPLIVHPILMPMMESKASIAVAAGVIAAFLAIAAAALIIDRRAILVSSLVYLGYAASTLVAAAGIQSSLYAVSALAVGAVVLMLSAAWRPLRRALIGTLPASLRARLPASQ